MKDRTTGKSRGFGFVTFQRTSDAAHAGNKEHMVDGRRCEVSSTPAVTSSHSVERPCDIMEFSIRHPGPPELRGAVSPAL